MKNNKVRGLILQDTRLIKKVWYGKIYQVDQEIKKGSTETAPYI